MTHTFSGFNQSELWSLEQLPDLSPGKIWKGGVDGRPAEASLTEMENLPNLTSGKMWIGNVSNRPVESDVIFAPTGATFVLRTANASLPNAIVLDEIDSGSLLKVDGAGHILGAYAGIDYASYTDFETLTTSVGLLSAGLATVQEGLNAGGTGVLAVLAAHTASILALVAGEASLGASVADLQTKDGAQDQRMLESETKISANTLNITALTSNLSQLSGTVSGKAPNVGTYIVKTADPNGYLPNAQAIDALDDGLLKHVDGVFQTAVVDVDYARAQTAALYAMSY